MKSPTSNPIVGGHLFVRDGTLYFRTETGQERSQSRWPSTETVVLVLGQRTYPFVLAF